MKTIYSPKYHQPQATRLTSTHKQKEVVVAGLERGLLRPDQFICPTAATMAEVEEVHEPRFVYAVKNGQPRRLAESQGFSWSPSFSESVFTIFNGQQQACREAVVNHDLVFHVASGAHHAGYSEGGGFCTFNFLVGGPIPMFKAGLVKRVLVVDLDQHQGNGTDELVRNDPAFSQFDISGCHFGVGFADQPHRYFNIVKDRAGYFAALKQLPVMLDAVKPDLVEYQAGMDCFDDDGGPEGMDEPALIERDRFVFEEVFVKRGIPTVWNLAGGYIDGGVTVNLHVNTIKEALLARRRRNTR